jgi:hypothetical protein
MHRVLGVLGYLFPARNTEASILIPTTSPSSAMPPPAETSRFQPYTPAELVQMPTLVFSQKSEED